MNQLSVDWDKVTRVVQVSTGKLHSTHMSVSRDRRTSVDPRRRARGRWALVTSAALLAFAACGGRAKPAKLVASNAQVGDCADPRRSGVLSDAPRLRSAHRDLNGDGEAETVFADRALCNAGNCSWNVFATRDGCSRYLGTVAGATLEVDEVAGEGGFMPIHAWWKLPSGGRFLVQNYAYRDGGYRLIDVLVCRQGEDDRLLCASEEPHSVLHHD